MKFLLWKKAFSAILQLSIVYDGTAVRPLAKQWGIPKRISLPTLLCFNALPCAA